MGQSLTSTEQFSILTVGTATEECTRWTVWVWVKGCCTAQAEFTFQ